MSASVLPEYQAPAEVASGIYQVPIPIPIPLKYVNCYLCQGDDGWSLVDTGFHDHLATNAWTRVFAELGIRAQDIDRLLVTHYHPDHIGAAGWLQQWTGAPAYIHAEELHEVELFWGTGNEAQATALSDFYSADGMPESTAAAIAKHHLEQRESVAPLPRFTALATGSRLRIGRGEYEIVWVPGHSDGMAVFWDAQTGFLLANDAILNKITPNVSLWPHCRPNPLQDYLQSLSTLAALGAKMAFPGHRSIITDVAGRCREIHRHHMERLQVMQQACASPQGATPWEVCERVFPPARLTIHQLRFAMSETQAHLVYLERQGRLRIQGNRYLSA